MYLPLLLLLNVLCQETLAMPPTNPLLWFREPCSSMDMPYHFGMRGRNGIYWGWNPDVERGDNITMINRATGYQATTVSYFSQINSPSGYDGHQLLEHLDEIKGTGAALIAAVMPNGLSFNEVTPAIAADIANVVRQFTDQGIEVWLRFAHEMNWYVKPGTYRGNSTQFIKAWQTVHAAVKDIEGCLMFWNPNNANTMDLYEQWWPGPEYVDIVGMDIYASKTTANFRNIYGGFYEAYAKKYQKHFVIPETATKPDDAALKQSWLKAMASDDLSAYPCLKSISWFELRKSFDYRVVMGQGNEVMEQSMENFR
ncbi:glycoside hydrolase superfamily [Neurospora tetraspora]|uniref:Glycoside hydrolase superfamily n=1 Tax=Neurospora tetraspora TaxID=94610 RepID=A0AAE0J179_9PEZI|nr:glycoside hydrolase superfamily [Neurospora tetraspora]